MLWIFVDSDVRDLLHAAPMKNVTLQYRIQPLANGWVSVQVSDDTDTRLWSYDLPTLERGRAYCRESFEARGAEVEFTTLADGVIVTQALVVEAVAA